MADTNYLKYVCVVMAVFVLYADVAVAVRGNLMQQRQSRAIEEKSNSSNDNEDFGMLASIIQAFLGANNAAVQPNDEGRSIGNVYQDDVGIQERHNNDVSTDLALRGTAVCGEWADPSGSECVCASSNRCSHTGGVVCDDTGAVFDSLCELQFSMCSGQTSPDRELAVCDGCDYLKLTGSSLFEEDPNTGLAIFRRVDVNGETEYEAMDESGYRVMKIPEWETWVIGKRVGADTYIVMKAIRAGFHEHVLSISHAGFYVLDDSGSETVWTIDPFMHFECLSDQAMNTAISTVQKRFFFTLFLVISLVLVTVTTTLHVVQSIKGCLYYPNLCTYTKEIENTLAPRVKRKQNEFKADFGDTAAYRDNIFSCFNSVTSLRKELIQITKLYEALARYTSDSKTNFLDFKDLSFTQDFDSALKQFSQYKDGLAMGAMIAYVAWSLTVTITAYSIVSVIGTTVSLAATVAAGVTVVLAAVAFIVDIFVSRDQERQQYEKVSKYRDDLLKYDREIDTARSNMQTVQRDFCKDLIIPMSKLSLASSNVDRNDASLSALKDKLESYDLFVEEPQICENSATYGRIKKGFLVDLKATLDTFITTVQTKKQTIIEKVRQARKIYTYLNAMRCDILENSKKPNEILQFARDKKPETVQTLFVNEFEMMKLIASRLFKDRSCYWGFNLADFRSGVATSSNYRQASAVKPCSSPEMSTFTTQMTTDVQTNMAPCRLLTRADSAVVPDMSYLMYFVALITLPSNRCYWGYDLNAIRSNAYSDSDLNSATIDSSDLSVLAGFGPSSVDIARLKMTNDFHVSNNAFQNFLLCMVNGAQWSSTLSCTGVPNRASCHITATANQCV